VMQNNSRCLSHLHYFIVTAFAIDSDAVA
jgi:hypothetical protein